MDEEILKKLDEQSRKLDAIYQSTEKTRKYFLWTLVVTFVMFILPLIGLMFVVPAYLNTLGSITGI